MLSVQQKRKLAGVLCASSLVVVLAACGSANASSDTQPVACDVVVAQLTTAQSELSAAQSSAAEKDGTDGQVEAYRAADQAQSKVDDLQAKQATCVSTSPTAPASTTTVSSTTDSSTSAAAATTTASVALAALHGDTQVVNGGGGLETVPFVSGHSVNDGDTRSNTDMPGLNALLPDCGVVVTWTDLVTCVEVNHAQWYIDGVNAHAGELHYNWDDVLRWGAARTPSGNIADPRVVLLYGSKTSLSDDEARAAVTGLTNGATLGVFRHDRPAFMNTWRTAGTTPSMTMFADYGNEVRVSLAPLVLNPDGTVAGINKDLVFYGVFVECLNAHGEFPVVPDQPGQPPLCPPGTNMAGQPVPAGGVGECSPPPPAVETTPEETPPGDKGCVYDCDYTPPSTWSTPPSTPPAGKQASEQPRDNSGAGWGETGGSGSGSYSDRGGQAVTTGDYSPPPAPPASAGQPAGDGAVATTRDPSPPSATASVEQTLHTDDPGPE